MTLEKYLVGTKEEISSEIESKVKTGRDETSYCLKWLFYEAAEIGLSLALFYGAQKSGMHQELASLEMMCGGVLAIDLAFRNAVQAKNWLEKAYRLSKGFVEIKKKPVNGWAEVYATPGMVGVLRKYSRKF
ncbi:hypothetical protein FJZ53_05680 [Candidatus Woesearchaeota archaeon]|nr:hypothetical protein [Candidatus Woesearchaeota archaeon]